MTWLADKAAWVLGIAAAVWGAIVYFKHQGKKDEQAADTERALQQAKEANNIAEANRNLSDAAARDKLRGDTRNGV